MLLRIILISTSSLYKQKRYMHLLVPACSKYNTRVICCIVLQHATLICPSWAFKGLLGISLNESCPDCFRQDLSFLCNINNFSAILFAIIACCLPVWNIVPFITSLQNQHQVKNIHKHSQKIQLVSSFLDYTCSSSFLHRATSRSRTFTKRKFKY